MNGVVGTAIGCAILILGFALRKRFRARTDPSLTIDERASYRASMSQPLIDAARIHLDRSGDLPLEFDGTLMIERTQPMRRVGSLGFSEKRVRLYSTSSRKFVVESVEDVYRAGGFLWSVPREHYRHTTWVYIFHDVRSLVSYLSQLTIFSDLHKQIITFIIDELALVEALQ